MPLSDAERTLLCQSAGRFDLELRDDQVAALGDYVELLIQWRTHARLVSPRQTRTDVIRKHIADAFALVEGLAACERIADVGSGAGLPGIPVAILRKDARVSLIEPNRRKANFLREVVRRLALPNVAVVAGRAEELVVPEGERFDAVVSRAVWRLAELIPRVRHLLGARGVVIAMKGPAVEQELAEIDLAALGFQLQTLRKYSLESGEGRILVLLRPRSPA